MSSGVLTSEWLKLRSVRSSYLVLSIALSTILMGLALAMVSAGIYDAAPPERQSLARIADLEEVLVTVPQLCLGILGAHTITSEYATGLIKTSMTLVPRRWPVLAAKSLIVGTLGLIIGTLVTFGTYFVTRQVLGGRFSGAYTTPFQDRLPLLIALSVTVPVFALLGMSLGALLRSAAGAITLIVGLAYVIPMIIGNIPEPWSENLGSLMIGALPREVTGDTITTSVYGSLLSPFAAATTMVAYAIVPLIASTWFLRQRDV